MPDDFSWFFASEYGRDRMLRDEIEGLQSSAYAASAQSARLSSQLRTLQGSIETRLQALSTAFDAYVELGDVREQLAGYPDTSAVRRDTLRALDALAAGTAAEPVDARGLDYWLVDAVDEVVALASGTAPGRTPERPTEGPAGPEHEMFVVAALGWLGHGERVGARVPPLLLGDGALAEPQVVLWRAVVHGLYGDVLEPVHERWQRDLDLSAPTWDAVAREHAAEPPPVGPMRWIADLLRGTWAPAPPTDPGPPADDRVALRSLVDALIGLGLGDERALLERARTLRARIEDPGAPQDVSRTEPTRTRTSDLVRQALLDPEVPAGLRRSLVDWVRPGLQDAAAQVAATVAAEQPTPTMVRTETGDVEVTPDGADPLRLARLDALAAERWSTPRSRLLAPGVSAGVALVVGLVLLNTSVQGLGVFLLLVAAALAVVLGRQLLRTRATRADLAAVRGRTRDRVEQGRVVAAAVRSATLETKAEVAGLARTIAGSDSTDTADATTEATASSLR